MSNEYFYARGEEQFGPVSGGQLKALATSGDLEPTDLVWKEGMPEWVEARRIKGLFPSAAAAPTRPAPSRPGGAASPAATPGTADPFDFGAVGGASSPAAGRVQVTGAAPRSTAGVKANGNGPAVMMGLNQTGLIVFMVLLVCCLPLCWLPFVIPSCKGE